jgi:Flp pilus assembly protein TadD
MARQRKGKRQLPTRQAQASADSTLETVSTAPSARQQRREQAIARTESKKRERILLIIALAITALAFFNSLNGEFVYDDQFQILKNPSLSSLANIPKMFVQSVWQFMNASSPDAVGLYYRPLFNTVLIINHQLFGANVIGWHMVSLLLHLAATFLVYKVALQWEPSQEISLAAALLFGLHPVHSESVAWISGIPDPLAAVFLLTSLYFYEKYYRGKLWQAGQTYLLVLSLVSAGLAFFSKEVAVAFPIFLALREFFDRREDRSFTEMIILSLKRAAPYLALVVVYMAARFFVLGFLSKAEPKAVGITTTEVFLTIPAVLLQYARMLFYPYPLSIIYDQDYIREVSDPRFLSSLIAVAALIALAVWLTHTSLAGRRALIWMLLFLLPVLNLKAFNPQESLIHDRYLYIPSIGFSILIAQAIYWLSQLFKAQQQNVFQAAMALICLVLFGLTFSQNFTWKDDLTMANNALQYAPNRPFLHNFIGVYHFNKNRPEEAAKYYQTAIENDQQYYDALSNLGDLNRMQGKPFEAEQNYLKAIAAGAPYAETFYNLAVVYTSQNRFAEAEEQLSRAVEISPTHSSARYNLGWVYDQQGKTVLAEQAYAKTLEINPAYPEPRINLAISQTKRGAFNEALNNLLTAQTHAPDHSVMLYALGDVNMRLNRHQDGIQALNRLIQKEPQHRLAYTLLGLCYEGLGNKEQARAHFQKAIEVAPQETYTNTAREHLAKL